MNHMEGGWKLIGCSGLLLFCVLCWLLNCFLGEWPPERGFEIEELLIDATVFPAGWRASELGPRPPAKAPLGGQTSIERTSLVFYTTGVYNGVAVIEIHRYVGERAAAREFERVMPIEFQEGEHWSPWALPEGFTYRSAYADRWRVGCARKTSVIEFCKMVGQYEEYVVRFSTKISPAYMTYQDFERVVRAIDERMECYLGKKPLSPP